MLWSSPGYTVDILFILNQFHVISLNSFTFPIICLQILVFSDAVMLQNDIFIGTDVKQNNLNNLMPQSN